MTDSPAPGDLVNELRGRFLRDFGGAAPRVFFSPGRVNLVGAHLDYNGGDVLPTAVDRGIYVAARLTAEPRLRLRSLNQEVEAEVATATIGERAAPEHGWAAYPIGVWRSFQARTGVGGGLDLWAGGDLPMASGLSSSAAIEVATALALDALHQTGLPREELALLCHEAETGFVGLNCGIMDQFATALGRPGHVLLLHCSGPRYEHVPLDPESCEILVMDTRCPRELADTGFNQRVAECAEALAILQRTVRPLPFLALYGSEDLDAAGEALGGVLRRRARHVVTEMQRVGTAVAALRAGDIATLGRMLSESHRSCAEDYEVSCPELDEITAAARACEGVYGARLTGAGFGGCAIALLRPGAAPSVSAAVAERYSARFGTEPAFDLLHAGAAPGEVTG